jgi:hypothetical protein
LSYCYPLYQLELRGILASESEDKMKGTLTAIAVACVGWFVFCDSAAAQQFNCNQFPKGERRDRCYRQQEQAYREEERTWREAEKQIQKQYDDGCSAVGALGNVVGAGGQFKGACKAPQYYDNTRRAAEEYQRRQGPQDYSVDTYFKESRKRQEEQKRRLEEQLRRQKAAEEERRRRRGN